MMKKLNCLLVFTVSLLVFGSLAFADSCYRDVCFDSVYKKSERELPLRGVGLHEFFRFDLYAGALYAPIKARTVEELLGNVPKVLVLDYQRKISANMMNRIAEKLIKKNPDNDYEGLRERIKIIGDAFDYVKKGDRYALVYDPEIGTSLYRNDDKVLVIPGEDFQRAYFGIWLSEYAACDDFRSQVLQSFGGGKL